MKKNALTSGAQALVQQFMQDHGLFPPSGRAWVAASAGADSYCLLFIMRELLRLQKLQEVRVLHVNHGLREQNAAEESGLKEWCAKEQLPLEVGKPNWQSTPTQNIEAQARQFRYDFFRSHLGPGDRLYTAHHLNDSFEWWLMSSFKSSELISGLGIPLKSGRCYRPLLCLSKKTIIHLARAWELPYYEDESNLDLRFERNFWRHQVIAPLAKRYPAYLKHYVYRSRALAQRLGVAAQPEHPVVSARDLLGGRFFYAQKASDFAFAEEELKQVLKAQSGVSRGRYGEQLQRLQEALLHQQEGPLSFAGGVQVHVQKKMLLILALKEVKRYQELDQKIWQQLKQLKKQGIAQIPGRSFTIHSCQERIHQGRGVFPFLVLIPELKGLPSRKRIHPLFPLSSGWLIDQQINFQTGAFLLYWGCNSPYFKDRRLDLQFLEDILI